MSVNTVLCFKEKMMNVGISKAFWTGFANGFAAMFVLTSGKRRKYGTTRVSTVEDAWRETGRCIRLATRIEELRLEKDDA